MTMWRLARIEVKDGTEVPGTYDLVCNMVDTDTGTEEVHVANIAQATYQDTPATLLAALVTAGYTPNDWGGV